MSYDELHTRRPTGVTSEDERSFAGVKHRVNITELRPKRRLRGETCFDEDVVARESEVMRTRCFTTQGNTGQGNTGQGSTGK